MCHPDCTVQQVPYTFVKCSNDIRDLMIFLMADASRYQYDGAGSDGTECSITEYNENRECNISFAVEEDMSGPVYVYYELTNFYQNHAT